MHIPSAHPDIRALARTAIGNVSDEPAQARALNRFVHKYLTYRPGKPPQSILTLLDDRVGDCTEFADLLTTLARSIGLPARTVFGLAYADGQEPAFAYHAWNEILADGKWLPFDPTWGQDRVDATHIPLPNDETAALMLLTGAVSLRFRVLEVGFFSD
jgi:transglutaminase-like putative cysteine protease